MQNHLSSFGAILPEAPIILIKIIIVINRNELRIFILGLRHSTKDTKRRHGSGPFRSANIYSREQFAR